MALVEKLPHSRRYYLSPQGYQICVVVLKPYAGDDRLALERTTQLDRLYRAVVTALNHLVDAVGLKAA